MRGHPPQRPFGQLVFNMQLLRKITFWLALLGTLAATSLVIRTRAALAESVTPPPIAPAPRPFPRSIGAAGLIEASHENVLVGAPQPGIVAALHVQVWNRVTAGQPLFSLDGRDLQAALLPQRAQVSVAQASLSRLCGQLARLEAVGDARAISAEELKLRRSDVLVAEAQLGAANAAVAQTEALLERLVVRAPTSGTVLQVNIRTGEHVAPGSVNAPVVIGDIADLQLRVEVDEQLAPRVRPGTRAVAHVKGDSRHPVELGFVRIEPFVIPKRSLTGSSIERVDTRVLQMIYRFRAPEGLPLYVGQQMDVHIEE